MKSYVIGKQMTGDDIRRVRALLGMTQREFAELLGVAPNEIIKRLPGYDCGSCGSPTCATFAEDIVRGYCTEMDCVHLLRERLKVMAEDMVELAQSRRI